MELITRHNIPPLTKTIKKFETWHIENNRIKQKKTDTMKVTVTVSETESEIKSKTDLETDLETESETESHWICVMNIRHNICPFYKKEQKN